MPSIRKGKCLWWPNAPVPSNSLSCVRMRTKGLLRVYADIYTYIYKSYESVSLIQWRIFTTLGMWSKNKVACQVTPVYMKTRRDFLLFFPFYKNLWSQKTPSDPDRAGIFSLFPLCFSSHNFPVYVSMQGKNGQTDRQTDRDALQSQAHDNRPRRFVLFFSLLSFWRATHRRRRNNDTDDGGWRRCVSSPSLVCCHLLEGNGIELSGLWLYPGSRTLRDGRERTSKGKERDSGHVRLLSPRVSLQNGHKRD